MRNLLSGASIVLGFACTACGGGTSGGPEPISSNPAPSPTPAPTPTPTPTSTYVALDALTGPQTFTDNARSARYAREKDGGRTGPYTNGARETASYRIAHDPASATYTISRRLFQDDDATITLGQVDVVAATAAYTDYAQTSDDRTHRVRLFNPGAGNDVLKLSYLSWGAWFEERPGITSLLVDGTADFFLFGQKTRPQDLPATGTASYNTHLNGAAFVGGAEYRLGGSATVVADFRAMELSTAMALTGELVDTGFAAPATLDLGSFTGTGIVGFAGTGGAPDSTFVRGTLASSGGQRFAGDFIGAFYGPGAAEIGFVFDMQRPNDICSSTTCGIDIIAGAVVGAKSN